MQGNLDELQAAVGYRFSNLKLLKRALTHYSYVYNQDAPRIPSDDNQQLEFLGDAVLGMIVSEEVFRNHPDQQEGTLHALKTRLVSGNHLSECARKLGLGSFLFLGRSAELAGARDRRNLLADVFEALIAAIYLDGGMPAATQFVVDYVIGDSRDEVHTDYKQTLAMLAHSRKLAPPEYILVAAGGLAHARTFTVEVRVGESYAAAAEGTSKKSASQAAAKALVERLRTETVSK
jgi:ribonuclease-3